MTAAQTPPESGPAGARVQSDALTACLTRRAFIAELERRLAREPDLPAALMVIDLDGFHEINADFGAAVGDQVLRIAAKRIAATLSAAECAGRLGGDEFGLLICGAGRVELADRLAERLLDVLDAPIRVKDHQISVTASIGVARRDDASCSADELLLRADDAMRESKAESRRSFRVHIGEGRRVAASIVRNRSDLQAAIEGDELSLALQPIFDAKSSQLASAEVLVRWHHKTLGSIAPSDFVRLAERSGLIVEMGWWVLDNAIDVLARHEQLSLAVNVSPLQFRRHGFALRVQELLHEHKVHPTRLEIEITESALVSASDVVERTLRQLRDVGVKVALDDFGTGFSNLGYLQRLAFDKLKLDQSFVRGLAGKTENTRLVRSIIDLGHSLDLKVVAEGVETRVQASLLALLGCDLLQGYALGVPLAEPEFCAQYAARAPNPAEQRPALTNVLRNSAQ
jgi:diguanylate cyclase (GGDEF)-like protein